MAAVLHLLKGPASDLALTTIEQQRQAGDRVTVVALEGAPSLAMTAGVQVHRVPADLSYDALLEKIFEADQVIAW